MSRLAALLLAGWAACGTSAAAPMAFERVLRLSVMTHPTVLSKRSEEDAAAAEKAGAEWARFPTPQVEAYTKAAPGAATGLVRVDQPLWAGGRISAGIAAADNRHQAATAGVAESRLDIAERVIAAYAEALRQKDRLSYATVSVQEHQRLLEMIKRRTDREVSSLADQRLAETRLFQAQTEQSLTSQAYQQSLTRLSQLGGENVTDVIWAGFSDKDTPQTLEAAIDAASSSSPTLRRLIYSEEAANADIDSRRSAYSPQLALRFEQTTGGIFPDSRVMLVLTAQPGAGLSAGAGVDAAIARREAVRQARAAADRELRERVSLDWSEWEAARSRLEAARQASEISQEVFESYKRQYVAGRKTWIDVMNAVRETAQARFTLADGEAQTAAASLRLRAQTGILKIDE